MFAAFQVDSLKDDLGSIFVLLVIYNTFIHCVFNTSEQVIYWGKYGCKHLSLPYVMVTFLTHGMVLEGGEGEKLDPGGVGDGIGGGDVIGGVGDGIGGWGMGLGGWGMGLGGWGSVGQNS